MIKYLKFLEDVYDGDKLIWKSGSLYAVTYSNNDLYYVESEDIAQKYGIEKNEENKKFIIEE